MSFDNGDDDSALELLDFVEQSTKCQRDSKRKRDLVCTINISS